jgi:hypothetical protein
MVSFKRSRKRPKKSRKKRTRRRSFGSKQEQQQELKQDHLYNLFSNFISPKELAKLLIYTKNISDNAFKQKPDESIDLNIKEKIERFLISQFRSRINDFTDKLTPIQILLLANRKYNDELKRKLLFNIDPSPIDESEIKGFKENGELLFLKSIFAKNLIENMKLFIKSLSDTQLVLLINGKYDLGNAMFNAFLHTEYPTKVPKN